MRDAGAELDRFALRWLRRAKVPGASLSVVQRGRPDLDRGYGFRDREARLPASARTVYGLASVTKSFTALAILRLGEEGALSTQDPVVRHLPEFGTPDPKATPKIRLHHFLTHTSGLPPLPSIYYTAARSLVRDPPYDPRVARRVGVDPDHPPIDTYEQILEYLRTTRYRLLGPPGRVFSYSNEGFGLLGAVIERASGRTYESYVGEEILRPAGMRSSTFDAGVLRRFPEVTTLYSPKRTGARHPLVPSQEWWDDTCLRASGGLRSTTEDLSQYLRVFLDGGRVGRERIIGPASLRKMLTPHVEIGLGRYYGYGVAIRPDYHGTPLVYHDGGLPGVSSTLVALPEKHLGAAVLSNAEQVPAELLAMAAVNQRLGLPLETPLVDVPRPVPARGPLGRYEGWYCSGEGIWLTVSALPDSLRVDFRGIELTGRNLRYRPAGPDAFVRWHHGVPAYLRFLPGPVGRTSAVFLGWRVVRRRDPRGLARARRGDFVW
ncbi:MAG: serine hydrolase domain-containing protein [Thermoplasmata archaeon]